MLMVVSYYKCPSVADFFRWKKEVYKQSCLTEHQEFKYREYLVMLKGKASGRHARHIFPTVLNFSLSSAEGEKKRKKEIYI